MLVHPSLVSTIFISTASLAPVTGTVLRGAISQLSSLQGIERNDPRPHSRKTQELNASAIISNGVIKLGINPEAQLIVPGGKRVGGETRVGIRYIFEDGKESEATSFGLPAEGKSKPRLNECFY